MKNDEWLEFEWIVKFMIKKLNIKKDLDEFYNLGLFTLYDSIQDYDESRDVKMDSFLAMRVRFSFMNEMTKRNKQKEFPVADMSDLIKVIDIRFRPKQEALEQILLHDVMNSLPDEMKRAIELRYEGFNDTEIGQHLYPTLTDYQGKQKVARLFMKIRKITQEKR